MTKRSAILAAALGAIVLGALPANSAERFRPPSEVLREPANVFALGKAIERLDPAGVRFEVVNLYSDERVAELPEAPQSEHEAPADVGPERDHANRQFDVRVGVEADVKVGRTYMIGITRFLRSRFPQPKWRLDPEGYRLVELPVVGHAIFNRSPDLEFLLTVPADTSEWAPRKTLDPILRLLRGSPIADRRVAALELLFQPQLGEGLTAKEIGLLRSVIEDESGDPVVRDYLLQATALFPGDQEPDWVADSARGILRCARLQVELGSAIASFQHTTLRILKDRGGPEDLDLAARLLRSASPGVTLSALQTMEALEPKGAVEEARAALSVVGLPEQSRRYIESFLRRAEHNSDQNKND